MYKNANRVIANKTRFMKNMTARHSIASLRLKQNVSKIGKTIDTQKVSAHEEIMLPALDTEATPELSQPVALLSRSRSSVRRQASFGLSDGSSRSEIKRQPSGAGGDEPKRMLNHEKLIATMNKVITAEKESIPEWEKRRRAAMIANSKSNGKNKTQISILLLERKLATVIKSLHKEVDNRGHGERLTNRMLLPHYKLSDLKNFLHIFQSVDEDYSGDLDVDEWIKFFNEMNKSFSPQQARMMFNKVDQNGDGYLSVSDLVPVIFNNATGEQKLHILKFLELELSKRKLVGNDFTTDEELEMLFEHYDTKFVGFIKISVIREKVKSFALPDAAHVAVMSLLNEHDDDEMVNFSEFRRIFQNYMAIV
jgi:Ca2+-binding EF-hand superfamily protein